ncbi:MAG: flavin reductase family protein [Lachnospiraceae bacterium]|nr:flavin reductase family protein [Lachnospiraceae bacterium]
MREYWKASNMLYPLPAVLICCADEEGKANVMTAAWAGSVCSDPVMVSVSIRKERYSYDIIKRTGEFTMCLTTEKLAKVTDYVGVKSGRDIDKFALKGELKLTKSPSKFIKAPGIEESPVCLECKVEQVLELGSHDMFIAKLLSTDIDDAYLDDKGRFDLAKAGLLAYNHGEYYGLGKYLGKFGYSVRKKKTK